MTHNKWMYIDAFLDGLLKRKSQFQSDLDYVSGQINLKFREMQADYKNGQCPRDIYYRYLKLLNDFIDSKPSMQVHHLNESEIKEAMKEFIKK